MAEYISAIRGVVSRPTMSGQSTVSQCSKEVGDFESSALPDTGKPPLLSERSDRKWG